MSLRHHRPPGDDHLASPMKKFSSKPALQSSMKPQREADTLRSKRGGQWHKTSVAYRAAHPICETRGCDYVSVEVHHKKHLADGGDLHDWNNLEALCHDCHIQQHKDDRGNRL